MDETENARVYLDTNVLLRLGRRSTKALEGTCYTSALALLELLAGIKEDNQEYASRRRVIIAVLDAPPSSVHWEFPDSLMTSCFSYVRETCHLIERRIKPFQRILECVRSHQDLSGFMSCEQMLNLDFNFEFFKKFDCEFGVQFREATEKGNLGIRSAFNANKAMQDGIVPAEVLVGSFRGFCGWFRDTGKALNRSITIYALAKQVVARVPSLKESKVNETYDGSIDAFVEALSFVSLTMTANMNLPGRNDALDLAHFLFLGNHDSLATDDEKMRTVAEAIGVSVLSSDELSI